MTTFSKNGYLVPKNSLSGVEKSELIEQLTVRPIVHGSNVLPPAFKVYRESENTFRVPRHFGYSKFGKPNKNIIPDGVHIDCKFSGTLKIETNQPEAVDETIKSLKKTGGGVLSLAPGFGKTTCALYIVSFLQVKTLIIVHKEFLMNQWRERIQQFLPDAKIGIIRQDKVDIHGKDICIAMLQSLSVKSYPKGCFDSFGFTVIDETHHICSRVFSQALYQVCTKYTLGLSATPERKDGLTKVLNWFVGDVCFSIQRENKGNVTAQIVDFKWPKEFVVPTNVNGQINSPGLINIVAACQERNKIIIDLLIKNLNIGRKIIVLSDRRQHCFDLLEQTKISTNNAFTYGLYLGQMKENELKHSETCQAIFGTFSLAHEGLDIPTLDTLILSTPKTDVVQSCGRIMRESNIVKEHEPLIIDIVDNIGSLKNQARKRNKWYQETGFNIIPKVKSSKALSKSGNNDLSYYAFLE